MNENQSYGDGDDGDILGPLPPNPSRRREKTKSDYSQFLAEDMMGSLVRRKRVSQTWIHSTTSS